MVRNFKQTVRHRKVIELATQGLSIPQIVLDFKSQGLVVCEKTVWSDFQSEMAKDCLSKFAKELMRKQLVDISINRFYNASH